MGFCRGDSDPSERRLGSNGHRFVAIAMALRIPADKPKGVAEATDCRRPNLSDRQ
jgi:hypothetical protein